MVRELKRWRLACPTNSLDLILPNEAGGPMNYSNMVQRYFFPALKGANLPRVRFHDLRHTNASLRLEIGENIKYIQTQLGHSSVKVTLDIYGHLFVDPEFNRQQVKLLEASLGAAMNHHGGGRALLPASSGSSLPNASFERVGYAQMQKL